MGEASWLKGDPACGKGVAGALGIVLSEILLKGE